MTAGGVGVLVRWSRVRRHLTQLELAADAGISARHLSFIETGRAQPSRRVLLVLAEVLGVPLRSRNTLLLAAGYAPVYPETSLSAAALAPVRTALERLVALQDPYPAFLLDRRWDILLANHGATALLAGLPSELLRPPMNALRLALHPDGLAGRSPNAADWSPHLLLRLRQQVETTGDPALATLLEEVRQYVAMLPANRVDPRLQASMAVIRLSVEGGEVALFTVLATLATPTDVTAAELGVELFYPADDQTARYLERGKRARENDTRVDEHRA